MKFKPKTWRPIAWGLCVVNLAGFGMAIGDKEPWHAMTHVLLAVAFAWWAQRLGLQQQAVLPDERLEALGGEVDSMRQQLEEAEERLDFAERMLANEKRES